MTKKKKKKIQQPYRFSQNCSDEAHKGYRSWTLWLEWFGVSLKICELNLLQPNWYSQAVRWCSHSVNIKCLGLRTAYCNNIHFSGSSFLYCSLKRYRSPHLENKDICNHSYVQKVSFHLNLNFPCIVCFELETIALWNAGVSIYDRNLKNTIT